jgi:hypothetical protein
VAHHLFIVSRQAPDLYSYLSKEFSSEPDVTVILDRRQGERRRKGEGRTAARPADRRLNDRRLKAEIASQLSTLGYAFVRLS